MMALTKFFQRSGGWIYLSGSLGLYLATLFLDSIWGMIALGLGAAVALLDPLVGLLARSRQLLPRLEGATLASWGLAAFAALAYFTRFFLEAPAGAQADDSALLPRLRLLLLALFLLSYAASAVYRIMAGLSESVEARASLSVREHRAQYLRRAAYSIFAVLPAVVLVNYGVTLRNPTLDLTPGYYSYSENGRSIIRSVQRDVDVYVFLPEKQWSQRRSDAPISEVSKYEDDIRLMLDQLPIINSRIRLHFLNADLEAFNTAEFGNVANGTIIFRTLKPDVGNVVSDRPYVERRIYVNTESDLKKLERESVRALVYVAAPARNAYFTSINGERYAIPASEGNPAAIELLKEQLRYFNVSVRTLDSSNGWPGKIPDDADVLFIVGPTTPFSQPARESVLQFLKSGGKVFACIDPRGAEDLSWLLKEVPGDYALQRARLTNTTLSGVLLTDSYGTHRITDAYSSGARRYLLVGPDFGALKQAPGASPVAVPPADQQSPAAGAPPADDRNERVVRTSVASLRELAPTAILFSSYNTFDDRNQNARREDSEPQERYTLGAAFEKPDLAGGPKLAIFSGTDWLADRHARMGVENVNLALAAQTLLWMVENPLAAGITPGERESRSVLVSDELKLRLIVLCVFVFPLAMTGALALAVTLYRRKRRFIEPS
ncbi:MAG: GldG family protein [Leptospirales bacterium]|nr:GldG family protein [Leptospirales bacterium]